MLSEDEAKFSQIQLRVFDRDTIRNEYMGELNFQTYQISDPFNTAADKVLFSFLAPVFSRIVPQWLPLHDKSGNHSGKLGEIQLRLGLSEDYLPETSQDRINLLVQNASIHDVSDTPESAFEQKEVLGSNVNAIDGLLSFEGMKKQKKRRKKNK